MSRLSRIFAALLVGALLGGVAEAHALLLSFTVEGDSAQLHYNGRIDAARSRVSLLKEDGNPLQQLEVSAGADLATVKASLKDVAPGSYILRWEVLSIDGHLSRGDKKLVLPTP